MGRLKNRLLIQVGFLVAQNPFLQNFFTGSIYQGNLKRFCTPGLNCYSCPAAAFSCPIGSLQLFFAGLRHNFSLFVTGFLLSVGVVFGKFICGYVCPMGLMQDLLYKIKSRKFILTFRFLRYIKYAVLGIFVIILPYAVRHELSLQGRPWFCAYVCPSGTILAAIPLIAANDFLRNFLGWQFLLKISIALAIIAASVFVLRIFCRILCPLGAIYGLFNRISVFGIIADKFKCVSCKQCKMACHIALDPIEQANSPECFRCGNCVKTCNTKAFSYGITTISQRDCRPPNPTYRK